MYARHEGVGSIYAGGAGAAALNKAEIGARLGREAKHVLHYAECTQPHVTVVSGDGCKWNMYEFVGLYLNGGVDYY